ncbi:hypothetical protein [Streptomyces sp. ODS28]|uniref:hypothetical protein n=1 Tax=Streptomyces sp. ODS28 TaxID=3136688 RepID=UPI0031EFE829
MRRGGRIPRWVLVTWGALVVLGGGGTLLLQQGPGVDSGVSGESVAPENGGGHDRLTPEQRRELERRCPRDDEDGAITACVVTTEGD